MFGRKSKRIKNLKENIKELNAQKMSLRNEYIRLQSDFIAYKNSCDSFIETVKELLKEIQEPKKPKSTKKTTVKKEKKNE